MTQAPSIKEALEFYAREWQVNGQGDPDTPGLYRSLVEPTDELFNDAGRKAKAALATLSPPAGERREAIKALAHRFWSIHPSEIAAKNLTREEFYEREMTKLLASGLVQDEAAIRKDEREKCLSRVCEALLVMSDGWKANPSEGDSAWVALSNAATLLCGKERVSAIRSARDGGAES